MDAAFSLAVARQKLVFDFLMSYPKPCGMVMTQVLAQLFVSKFLSDRVFFQEFKAWEHKTKSDQMILERSSFNLVSVKQNEAALDQLGGKCAAGYMELVDEQHSVCIFKHIVGDPFGIAKNNHEQRTTSRFRKPERA